MADTYYPKVKDVIGLGTIPDDVLGSPKYLSTQLYLQHAEQAGLDGQKITAAMDWSVVQAELAGTVPPSATVGESIFGMNNGSKNSVDRNYLAQAEETDFVEIYPLHVVKEITQPNTGGYKVTCERINESGKVVEKVILNCTYLFMAAGSMGTTKLLVRARETGTLPNLNQHVGKHWGNNGDRLWLRILAQSTGAPQGGPACTAIFDHDNPITPLTFEHGPAPLTTELFSMAMLGMGIPDKSGHFFYSPITDNVKLVWPLDGDATAVHAMWHTHHQLNTSTSGLFTIDMNAFDRYTYHPLGGAVLGKACDYHGRVSGYPKMYVIDASLIAGSSACCNPAWTVAALAERCMENIIGNDF